MRLAWAGTCLVLSAAACGGPDSHAVDTTKSPAKEASTSASQLVASPNSSPDPTGASLQVTISGENVGSNVPALSMTAGGPLRVTVRSDRSGELHFQPNHARSIDFTAGMTGQIMVVVSGGIFEIEEHDSGIVVTQLAVNDPAN